MGNHISSCHLGCQEGIYIGESRTCGVLLIQSLPQWSSRIRRMPTRWDLSTPIQGLAWSPMHSIPERRSYEVYPLLDNANVPCGIVRGATNFNGIVEDRISGVVHQSHGLTRGPLRIRDVLMVSNNDHAWVIRMGEGNRKPGHG